MGEILFLAHRIPYPPNKGDKIRSWHILEHLSRSHKVHMGCFVDDAQDWQYVSHLKSVCAETHFSSLGYLRARLRSLKGLMTGAPLTIACYQDRKFDSWVRHILESRPIEAVFLFSSATGQFMEGRYKSDQPVVMDYVDVDSDKWAQYAKIHKWPMSWIYQRESRVLLEYERALAKKVDAGLFVSQSEADMFRQLVPEAADRIGYLNNGVDFESFAPARAASSPYSGQGPFLVFTGAMDYWANVDAVQWFAREIFPEIRKKHSQAQFYIVGGKPTNAVQELSNIEGISVTGRVPEVQPYLGHADVVVCPMRIARGIQNKVLEGMAMGKAVVATGQAFEGISARPGEELLVADDPEDFARSVCDLLDGARAGAMGEAARARILSDYGWSGNLARLEDMLHKKSSGKVTGSQPIRKIS